MVTKTDIVAQDDKRCSHCLSKSSGQGEINGSAWCRCGA